MSIFITKAIIVSAITIVGGLLLTWWASTFPENPVWSTFWLSVGTTTLSVGILGILYESLLKKALITDIQQGSQLENRILNSGLKQVATTADHLDLNEFFSGSRELDIVPSSPLTWLDTNYDWLIPLARSNSLVVRIYLPEPIKYSEIIAHIDGSSTSLHNKDACIAQFDRYRDQWTSERIDATSSRLEIYLYSGYPSAAFIVADSAAVIYATGTEGINSRPVAAYLYKGTQSDVIQNGLRLAVEKLEASAISGTVPDTRQSKDIIHSSAPAAANSLGSTISNWKNPD